MTEVYQEIMYVITENGIVNSQDVTVGIIREISTKEELTELMERMPYIQTIQAPNGKVRKELYELSMKEYDDVEWVKVIKSVYIRMEDREYDDFEVDYMKKAKKFLYQEIALRFLLPFDEVEHFINKTVEKHLEEF